MTLAPFELDTSLSPPRREVASLTAEKRNLEKGCRWAQQNAEKLPPTSKKREGGDSQKYFDAFGDHLGREGGRAEQWLTVFEVCEVSLLLL